MQQEARNTETHTRDWLGSSLRHKAVVFVKARELQHSEFETVDQADQQGHGPSGDDQKSPSPATRSPLEPQQEDIECGFFFDNTPQDVTDTALPDPIPRTLLSDPDDSSEDEVVFTGRNTRPIVIETSKEELQFILQVPSAELVTLPEPITAGPPTRRISQTQSSRSRSKTSAQDTRRWTREDEDNMMADYIANMDTDYCEGLSSHLQVEVEAGIDIADAVADEELDQDKAGNSLAGTKEAQVQSSIDGKCTKFPPGPHIVLTRKAQCYPECVSIQKQSKS